MVLQQSIIDDRFQGFIDHQNGNRPKHIRYVKTHLRAKTQEFEGPQPWRVRLRKKLCPKRKVHSMSNSKD